LADSREFQQVEIKRMIIHSCSVPHIGTVLCSLANRRRD
jgi:hypothetical protein